MQTIENRFDEICQIFGVPNVGESIRAERNDGKVFEGRIESVRAFTRGILIVVKRYDDEGPVYRSVYLEDCRVWYTANV